MTSSSRSRGQYQCSFCGKSQEQVSRLIAGPNKAYICDQCVALCREIIDEVPGNEEQQQASVLEEGALPYAELRDEMVAACRVLTFFDMVQGFGHVSARIPGTDRWLITPRKALGLVEAAELVELDMEGRQVGGEGRPPLESVMHLAVYRRRADVLAMCRAHPPYVAAYACAATPISAAHGFGANLGAVVPVFAKPFLITDAELAEGVAEALGQGDAVILQANGMLATGESVPDACVKALFLEEMARAQLTACAAGLVPQAYTPQAAARRRGSDKPNEPVRAWEYFVAVAEGRL